MLPACGFKEWSLVCEALGSGRQSIILRKGGIHEGSKGFWWQHDRFFLFPTHFHEQDQHFAGTLSTPLPADLTTHRLEFFADVEWKGMITDWDHVQSLCDFHHWSEAAVKERFSYTENQGISLALLRIYRLSEPWAFPDEPRFRGCRSWLSLPPVPESITLTPVLTDARHKEISSGLLCRLPPTAGYA